MSRRKLSNAQLRKAAAQVRDSMLAQLPADDVAPVQPNRDFCLRMEKKEMRLRLFRQARQQAIAALLALVVGFGCLMTFNTEVRAAVVSWFKEMYETYVVYHFPGESPEVLPDLEFTWLPEGMELVDKYEEADYFHQAVYLYPENTEMGFVIDWSLQGYGEWTFWYPEQGYHTQEVNINGYSGELVMPESSERDYYLIWVDEEWGVVLMISSPLDIEVIVHIAEGIILSDPTK